MDDCGVCDGDNADQDCTGECFGYAYYDNCGYCVAGTTGLTPCTPDCNDVWGGASTYDDCGVCDDNEHNDCLTISINLSTGANLISFYALPDNLSLGSIFSSLVNNINLIITEGAGSVNLNGTWYGSLYEISPYNGYWVIMDTVATLLIPEAVPSSFEGNDLQYQLHSGNNLISYPFAVEQAIGEAISSEYDNSIWAVAGSGIAALNISGNWYGSLEYLNPSSGYWIVSNIDTQFYFNQPGYDGSHRINSYSRPDAPDLFTFSQSTYQAFYWVYNADIEDTPLVVNEDWIGAFYGDECIGARVWSGLTTLGIPTDIPVMGYDDDIVSTQNYIIYGEYPRFVIYDASENQYFDALAGGVLCPQCGSGKPNVMPVSMDTLRVMRFLQRNNYSSINNLSVRSKIAAEIEKIQLHYISIQLERQLKSVDFLDRVRRLDINSFDNMISSTQAVNRFDQ